MLTLEIEEARRQGHDDAEIAKFIATRSPEFSSAISRATQEGYTPTQVLDYLGQALAPTQGETAARGLGLWARAAAPIAAGAALGAAAGAPLLGVGAVPGAAAGALAAGTAPMLADPLVALYNMATGSNVTAPSQAMEDLLTRYGLPAPITRNERLTQAGMRGAISGFGGAQAAARAAMSYPAGSATRSILQTLGTAPGGQAAAGGAATTAGQYVAEEGGGPGLQMGAALGAGMLAPGGSKVAAAPATTAGKLSRAIVSPFSTEGRQAIVGSVLNRLATDPAAAIRSMQNYEPRVPGSAATTAGASRDPGIMSAETAVRGAFDTTGLFPQRISANNDARLGLINRIAKDEQAIADAKAKRRDVTGRMREDAFDNADPSVDLLTPVRAQIQAIMSGPKGASEPVAKSMQWLLGRLDVAGNDPRRLYEVRKDLARAASGQLEKEYPGMQAAGGQLLDVQRTLDSMLEQAAPGYSQYMAQFRKSSRPIDQMGLLQRVRQDSLLSLPNPVTGNDVIGASKWTGLMRSRAEEIGDTLSPTQQRILERITRDIEDGVAPQTAGRVPGSDTIKNMTIGNLVGRMLGEKFADNSTVQTLARPLAWLYKLPEEQVQRLLVEAMLDPKLAADFMAKANVMRVGGMSDRLKARAQELGISGAVGSTEAEARRNKAQR